LSAVVAVAVLHLRKLVFELQCSVAEESASAGRLV
jgi:hypothetical protein